MTPTLTVHVLGPSHPCRTVEAALRLKGLDAKIVTMRAPEHNEELEAIYGAGNRTVPGMLVDDEPVHGSRAILARLEELAPQPSLYPAPIADAVREAERWGDEDGLQDLGRRLPWGALRFRPEAMGTFIGAGSPPLDPAGIDFALGFIPTWWEYHGITAVRLAEDLAGLPAKIDHIDALAANGIVGGEQPNAADLQIGASLLVLLTLGDLRPLIEGRPAEQLARRWFDAYPGDVPAGAFPAGWVPAR